MSATNSVPSRLSNQSDENGLNLINNLNVIKIKLTINSIICQVKIKKIKWFNLSV